MEKIPKKQIIALKSAGNRLLSHRSTWKTFYVSVGMFTFNSKRGMISTLDVHRFSCLLHDICEKVKGARNSIVQDRE